VSEKSRRAVDAKFQRLVSDSHTVFAILGSPTKGQTELANIEPKERAAEFARRQGFLGMVGIVGIKPRTALAVELDSATITALSQAFLSIVENAIRSMNGADSLYQSRKWSELT
jgi:hypothetical protein